MANAPRRITQRQLEADVNREVARVRDDYTPAQRPSGKCRVCLDPASRTRVNTMLSHGMIPTEIVKNLGDINAKRPKNRQIGYWSVRDHRENHFDLQAPAAAAWTRMLEKYAEDESELVAKGVGTLLTGRGMLKIMGQKGFEHLMKDDTEVDFEIGAEALLKLEKLEAEDKGATAVAAIRRDVALLQQAIIEELSEEQMRKVSKRVDILRGVASADDDDDYLDAETDDEDDDLDDFDREDDSSEAADFNEAEDTDA